MRIGKYFTGVKIKYNKKDNHKFINIFSDEVDINIMLISLLEMVNDICKQYNVNTNDILKAYMKYGSVDNCENKTKRSTKTSRKRASKKGEEKKD